MPRKKKAKEPAKSTDLVPHGEGILEGVHYDPLEPSTYRVEGIIPEFANLADLLTLESGPEILETGQFKIDNPLDEQIEILIILRTESPVAQFQLSNSLKREYIQGQIGPAGRSSISLHLDPSTQKTFKLLVATFGQQMIVDNGSLRIEYYV